MILSFKRNSYCTHVQAQHCIRYRLEAYVGFGVRKNNQSSAIGSHFLGVVYRPPKAICLFKQVTVVSINFSTAVRQAQQPPTKYSSAVENFRFSTTDNCNVEPASVAKLSLRPPMKGKGVIFHKPHRVTESRRKYTEYCFCIHISKDLSGYIDHTEQGEKYNS